MSVAASSLAMLRRLSPILSGSTLVLSKIKRTILTLKYNNYKKPPIRQAMEELGMDPDEISDEDCSSLRWLEYILMLKLFCNLMNAHASIKTPGMSARQFPDVQV